MTDLDGIKILVVEDDLDTLAAVQSMLVVRHAEVSTATTVAEAIEALAGFVPDVIVSDIHLGGQDGYQFMRLVRSRGKRQGGETPAIAITGNVSAKQHTLSLQAGYSMHIGKPVEPETLFSAILDLTRPGA